MLDFALLSIFPGAMAFAAAMDLLTMTIPNRISLALIAGFAVLAPLSGMGGTEIAAHVAVGAGALVVGIALFAMGWIGGGDAKIFAAGALWLGPDHLLIFAAVASIAGGALTLLLLFFRMLPLPAWAVRVPWLDRLHRPETGVPYGIALAAAALIIYPMTPWFTGFAGS